MTAPRAVAPAAERPILDTSTPNIARMYDYYLSGRDNYQADRDAARQAMSQVPDARAIAVANRLFLIRVVTTMVRAGITQILDLGSGLPTQQNVHEVVQKYQPETRVVYVDHDPVAIAHSRALLETNPNVGAIHADIRQPKTVLQSPTLRNLIDFNKPVGVLLVAILHFIPPEDEPASIVDTFRNDMVPGSMLAISHISSDHTHESVRQSIEHAYRGADAPAVFRTMDEIQAFFPWPLIHHPGLVEVGQWRADLPVRHDWQLPTAADATPTVSFLGGVAAR